MSEYIVNVPDGEAECFIARFGLEDAKLFGYSLTGEIVRCRDCRWRMDYSDAMYCDRFASSLPPVEPDDFCSWGEMKAVDE